VDAPLVVAGLLDGMHFRPKVVGAEEIVADPQPAGGVAF